MAITLTSIGSIDVASGSQEQRSKPVGFNAQVSVPLTGFQFDFADALETLKASAGTWFMVTDSDRGYLKKQELINSLPADIVPGYKIETLVKRTKVDATGRRQGVLYARVVLI